MKKLSMIFLYLFLLSIYIAASESFVLSRGQKSKTFTYSYNVNTTRFITSLNQNEDGLFSLSCPPFISLKTPDNFYAGELKYSSDYRLRDVTYLSMYPVYSGFAKKFKSADFAVFTPVINPKSPQGFSFYYENKNFHVFLKNENHNEKYLKSLNNLYQINWDEMDLCTDRWTFALSNSAVFRFMGFKVKTSVFSDTYSDNLLGVHSSAGWEINADSLNYLIKISKKLKGGSEDVNDNFKISIRTKGSVNMGFSYETRLYAPPVYGGTSRRNAIVYSEEANIKNLRFKGEHTFEIQEDTGHTQQSDYSILLTCRYFKLDGSITLGRTGSDNQIIKHSSICFSDSHSKLELTDSKAKLSLSYNTVIAGMSCKFSLTQDRLFTVSVMLDKI